MSINHYKALLFDFDGVIAQTMPFHLEAWKKTLSEYGAHLDDAMVLKNEGRQAFDIARRILQHAGIKADETTIEHIVNKKNRLFRSLQKKRVYPEIHDILSKARKNGFKIALVTGTVLENVRAVVPPDILEQFDTIIDGNAVALGKPAPDPYLAAAERLGVIAADCVVIENAPMGIRSANAAKMFCIAVCTTLGREQLKGADVKLQNHTELELFLEQSVFQ